MLLRLLKKMIVNKYYVDILILCNVRIRLKIEDRGSEAAPPYLVHEFFILFFHRHRMSPSSVVLPLVPLF